MCGALKTFGRSLAHYADVRLERGYTTLRWLAIGLVVVAAQVVVLPAPRLHLIYWLLLAAAIYNLLLERLILRRRLRRLHTYLSAVVDTGANAAMFWVVGGGWDSPYYFISFILVIGIALRHAYALSFAAAAATIVADFLAHAEPGQMLDARFVVRSGFLLTAAFMASYLSREAAAAQRALAQRLDQVTTIRQVAASMSAMSSLGSVIQDGLAAACALLDAPAAIYLPPAILPASRHSPVAHSARSVTDAWTASLEAAARTLKAGAAGRRGLHTMRLPGGAVVAGFDLRLTDRPASAGMLVVGSPRGDFRVLDADLLDAFLRRMALAVENARMYQALKERNADLQRAYDELQQAHSQLTLVDHARTDFLANVSHEFRTPLTAIRAFSELLLTYDDPLVHDQFLSIISAESERLTLMVDDVLEMTRLDGGYVRWRFGPTNLAELLRDLARDFAPRARAAGLRFHLDLASNSPIITADRHQLHSALEKLLDNALKFTNRGSITLRLSAAANEVRIDVSDTGAGIPPEEAARVFEKFFQGAPSQAAKPRGVGLGLPICLSIVNQHGGHVDLRSSPGKGATFTVTLPVSQPRRVSPPPAVGAVPVA